MKRPMLIAILAAVAFATMSAVVKTGVFSKRYQAGEIYSVQGERGYQVAKILVVEPGAVHIRLYKNVFSERPRSVDARMLDLGNIHDPDGFGIGHLPLTKKAFDSWEPMLISRTSVSAEELEGYEEWKKAQGGLFGEG
jgi:hypothetical protein